RCRLLRDAGTGRRTAGPREEGDRAVQVSAGDRIRHGTAEDDLRQDPPRRTARAIVRIASWLAALRHGGLAPSAWGKQRRRRGEPLLLAPPEQFAWQVGRRAGCSPRPVERLTWMPA